MSKSKAKIEKIVIDIHGEKLELTPGQAKELRDILCDMYGPEKVVEKHIHHDGYRYWNWYPYPIPYTATETIPCVTTCGYSDVAAIGSSNISSGTVYLAAA